ncbi:DUF2585 family protein [Planctomycetales bacterium ZRK34]|nr:DUF2585 family protein [Planctomycetales bacterium ZRK34]
MTPKWGVVIITALIVLTGLIEVMMGRPIVSKTGRIMLWVGDTGSAELSQQIADWYTFSHVIHGFLFYGALRLLTRRWGVSVWTLAAAAVFIEAGWEVLENTSFIIDRYRATTLAQGYYGDSVLNSVCDILACAAGVALARVLPVRISIAIVIVIELAMLWFIRDNLTLNVIMLLYPFESISRWQTAG